MTVKKRIVQIMNEIRMKKEGKNTFSNYNYFRPDDIFKELNELLLKHGLITIFNLIREDKESEKVVVEMEKNNVKTITEILKDKYIAILEIVDVETDESIKYEFHLRNATLSGANDAQNAGATLTYAKRYLLMNAFNIAENDLDPDTQPPIEEKQVKKTEPKQEQKQIQRTNTTRSKKLNQIRSQINAFLDSLYGEESEEERKKHASELIEQETKKKSTADCNEEELDKIIAYLTNAASENIEKEIRKEGNING